MSLFQSKRKAKRNETLRNAKNAYIEVEEHYRHERGKFVSTPRYKCREAAIRITENWLNKFKIRSVRSSEPFDFRIKIRLNGFCFPKTYRWRNGRQDLVYSGARVSGSFRLIVDDNLPKIKRSFFGQKDNPETLRDPGYRTRPVYAPFDEAFKLSAFNKKMGRVLNKYCCTN